MTLEPRSRFYEFGAFSVDVANRMLLRNGSPVTLTPKAFDTLLLLVQNAGQVLPKPDLMSALWPDSYVDENNLAQNISAIRKALGQSGTGRRWITTVAGHGYRFEADVRQSGHLSRAASAVPGSRWRIGITALLLVAAGLAGVWLYTKSVGSETDERTVTRLTYSGDAVRTAVSPAGRYVAIVTGELGNQALTIRELATGKDIYLAEARLVTYMGLTFTPAETELYVLVRGNAALTSGLYRIEIGGRRWSKVLEGIDSPVTFSPDGQRFAFIREDPNGGKSVLVVRDRSQTAINILSRNAPDLLDYPSWSPDGRTIVCTLVDRKNNLTGLLAVPLNGAPPFEVGPRCWRNAMRLIWAGGQLMMIARQPRNETMSIWTISYPDGRARKLTKDLEYYYWLGATSDGRTIAAAQRRTLSSIWVTGVREGGEPRQISPVGVKYSGLTSTRTGTILFARGAGNVSDIWRMNADGSGQVQLTRGTNTHLPTPCGPTGQIAYVAERDSAFESWLMEPDGSQARPLFRHNGNTDHDCSLDGKWIIHTASEGGWQKLWRTATQGGFNQKLSDAWMRKPAVSPDGKHIAAFHAEHPESTQEAPNQLAIIPFGGGAPELVFTIDDSVHQLAGLRWTPEGTGISYVKHERGVGNIWMQPLSGAPPRRVTNFTGDRIFYFCWARDASKLFVVRGITTHDIVLLRKAR